MESLKELKDDDLYAVLQIQDGGSHVLQATIGNAYRKCALRLHPDKHKGDPIMIEEFMKLTKAYDILNDVEARASYDAMYEAKRRWKKKERKLSDKRQMMINRLVEKENKAKQDRNANSQHEDYVRGRLKEEITEIVKRRGGKFTFIDGTSICAPKPKIQSHQPPIVNPPNVQHNEHQPFEFAQPYQPPSVSSLPPNWGKARSYQPPT